MKNDSFFVSTSVEICRSDEYASTNWSQQIISMIKILHSRNDYMKFERLINVFDGLALYRDFVVLTFYYYEMVVVLSVYYFNE